MAHPLARSRDLLVQPVGDELLVFDQTRNLAHTLNKTAALIFQHADGTRSTDDLVALLQANLNGEADADLVQMSLAHLRRAHLLQEAGPRSPEALRAARRRFVKKVGLVGALTLMIPVVETTLAPTPAMAQSGSSCDAECLACCVDGPPNGEAGLSSGL